MDLLKSFSFDSGASDDSTQKDNINTMTTTSVNDFDWVDDAVDCIARACNLCGQYEIQQVGYEWIVEQKRQGKNLSTKQFEVELYRKFLFDESSVGDHHQ
jgi:hypothetical protein